MMKYDLPVKDRKELLILKLALDRAESVGISELLRLNNIEVRKETKKFLKSWADETLEESIIARDLKSRVESLLFKTEEDKEV